MISNNRMLDDGSGKIVALKKSRPGSDGPGIGLYRDAADVIARLNPDYPVYCFAPSILKAQVGRFLSGFAGDVAYAVKANSTPEVMGSVAAMGIRVFDVASLLEIEQVLQVAPDAELLYDNPIKSRAEIGRAYHEFGVRSFALDDEAEFHKLNATLCGDPSVQLTVRVKLARASAVHDLTRKFGATEQDAIALLRTVNAAGYRPALTFHPGSQCLDPRAYADYIEACARIAAQAGVELTMVNVGGGFPAPYLNEAVLPLAEYFRAIKRAFAAHFDTALCRLVCEPGRALVAPAVSLLCRVKHRRGNHTVFLNDGIYGGLMEQYVVRIDLPLRVWRGEQRLRDTMVDFEIFGPTCDSHDRLPVPLRLPESIAEGDYVEFGLLGAYGSVTATRFNGYTSDSYLHVKEGFPMPVAAPALVK
jgi:ornithine decarboxylase